MHDAAEAVVVVDRVVLGAAVVPEGERSHPPGEAAGELRFHLVLEQELQERRAFRVRHAAETRGMRHVHIQRLAAGLGVGAHQRVLRIGLDPFVSVLGAHAPHRRLRSLRA